jgi:hypothetical protein
VRLLAYVTCWATFSATEVASPVNSSLRRSNVWVISEAPGRYSEG